MVDFSLCSSRAILNSHLIGRRVRTLRFVYGGFTRVSSISFRNTTKIFGKTFFQSSKLIRISTTTVGGRVVQAVLKIFLTNVSCYMKIRHEDTFSDNNYSNKSSIILFSKIFIDSINCLSGLLHISSHIKIGKQNKHETVLD